MAISGTLAIFSTDDPDTHSRRRAGESGSRIFLRAQFQSTRPFPILWCDEKWLQRSRDAFAAERRRASDCRWRWFAGGSGTAWVRPVRGKSRQTVDRLIERACRRAETLKRAPAVRRWANLGGSLPDRASRIRTRVAWRSPKTLVRFRE